MPKRKFELPGIQDLSKEQEEARALPKEGQHLIVGGPGTGKSVLALIRARRYFREKEDYLFLVYNRLLDTASGQLFGGLASQTYIGWFLKEFPKITGKSVPRLNSDSEWKPIDWPGVEKIVEALPEIENKQRFLIIDEGQDMPQEFYNALVNLGFNRFFVVADQNQQIGERNSSRRAIENCLAIDADEVIELKQNYRNHYQVAKLARKFYTGDPASPPPELPEPARGRVPMLYRYNGSDLNKVVRHILLLSDRDPRQLIGIITPNNAIRKRYLDALQSLQVPLDNPRPAIRTYYANMKRVGVAFNEGGILVINAQSCKGLEFDVAILADIDEHRFQKQNPDAARRLFYVMVARARDQVFMFMKRNGRQDIEEILPEDNNVLRREELK